MRDPELVFKAQLAASALERAWHRWRLIHGLVADPMPAVSSYVGYSLEQPWGQPRVVLGLASSDAEQLAALLDRHDCIGPVRATITAKTGDEGPVESGSRDAQPLPVPRQVPSLLAEQKTPGNGRTVLKPRSWRADAEDGPVYRQVSAARWASVAVAVGDAAAEEAAATAGWTEEPEVGEAVSADAAPEVVAPEVVAPEAVVTEVSAGQGHAGQANAGPEETAQHQAEEPEAGQDEAEAAPAGESDSGAATKDVGTDADPGKQAVHDAGSASGARIPVEDAALGQDAGVADADVAVGEDTSIAAKNAAAGEDAGVADAAAAAGGNDGAETVEPVPDPPGPLTRAASTAKVEAEARIKAARRQGRAPAQRSPSDTDGVAIAVESSEPATESPQVTGLDQGNVASQGDDREAAVGADDGLDANTVGPSEPGSPGRKLTGNGRRNRGGRGYPIPRLQRAKRSGAVPDS